MKRISKARRAMQPFAVWFAYLRLARQSTDPKVKAALIASQAFYAPWEMDKADRFDPWWIDHRHLFAEKFVVRELKAGEAPLDPNALLIEVPLTQSPTMLTKRVKRIIQVAFEARERTKRKGKKNPTAYYRLSDGAEPKFHAVVMMLLVYRHVALKHPKLRGERLLDATHRFFSGGRDEGQPNVPMALMYDRDGDKARAMRNLRRYIQKAEKVMLNVAHGIFPGEY